MRIHEYMKKSMRLVLVVTAFVIAGSVASQLCAAVPSQDEAPVKAKRTVKKRAQKKSVAQKTKKTAKKKVAPKKVTQKKATKKSRTTSKPARKAAKSKKVVKPEPVKTNLVKADKVIVAPSELDIIKDDKYQGKWEEYSRADEKLAIDNIAVGSNGVLYGVDKETKNFYQHDGKDWILKKAGDVKFITVAMDGSVLLISDNGGVFLYKDGAITPVAESKYNFDSIAALSSSDIYGIVNDEGLPYGNLYHLMRDGNWEPVLVGSFASMVTGKKMREASGLCDVFTTAGKVWVIDYQGNAWHLDIP